LKDKSLESDRLAILNQLENYETIKISDAIFNSYSFGRFTTTNLNINLWLPKKETDSFMTRCRTTGQIQMTTFFEMLFYTLEHESLHKILYEVFDLETTVKFDSPIMVEAFPIEP